MGLGSLSCLGLLKLDPSNSLSVGYGDATRHQERPAKAHARASFAFVPGSTPVRCAKARRRSRPRHVAPRPAQLGRPLIPTWQLRLIGSWVLTLVVQSLRGSDLFWARISIRRWLGTRRVDPLERT